MSIPKFKNDDLFHINHHFRERRWFFAKIATKIELSHRFPVALCSDSVKDFTDNSQKKWLHFGDTDPDEFLILHNPRNKTGIDFQPYLMGIYELTCFERYCKPLEPYDITKAKSMAENQIYLDIARFMPDSNHKLEQEIISWKNK